MIKKGLIDKIFDAANIKRWNDHITPMDLTELDKQAHKFIIAYLLAKNEEHERNVSIDWIALIEGGIHEFLHRVLLTDIKPPVFHKMMKEKGEELNKWVIDYLKDDLKATDENYFKRFVSYLNQKKDSSKENKILSAAHYLATNWEFQIVYHASPFIYGIENTKSEIENQIEDYYDLIGVQKIFLRRKSFGFVDLCGQLRFQKRWAQVPRIPETSVLGHMLLVAIFSYFACLKLGACSKRTYNNFYASLFHDLPEVLTRDIVSPIKKSVEGLEETIKKYEGIQIEQRILPLLPEYMHEEIKFFITNEFSNKIRLSGSIVYDIEQQTLHKDYNEDKFDPVDGEMLKTFDILAAYLEARKSIQYGIKASRLTDAIESIEELLKGKDVLGLDLTEFFK